MLSLLRTVSLIFILSCIAHLAYAKTINIKSTATYTENTTYYLDALFDYGLTEEAEKALLHGITLEIHTLFQLRLKREWLWNKTISEKIIIYTIEHKPLTKNFMIIDLKTGIRNSYSNLNAALNHINLLSKIELFDINVLNKNKNYIARIKTFLDIGSLPPPMRPQAYFYSNWDMSSEWLEWEIKP
ncbi:MAG TPA: DUF4390 domain-containing protein [Thiotrichaceae bacterium]|jgi:hypothetical protein|nr:DUF4390 domain-containing protein [Thiotrichaceae bacterium]HIM07666.1 DUF4390 domain-containing protein [Gammaproteobacteria bacterium]